jgi:hypothetical protein
VFESMPYAGSSIFVDGIILSLSMLRTWATTHYKTTRVGVRKPDDGRIKPSYYRTRYGS